MAQDPLTIRLLGRPSLECPGRAPYRLRSRKSWALLAYLLLFEGTPTRSQLAGLLFCEADDPLRALRWSLAELRRCLGDNASVEGDPVVLRLPENVVVDVDVLSQEWVGAVEVVGLGAELLEGLVVRGAPAFESWLLAERRRVAAASEAILHEAALGLMARGALDRAHGFAVRAAAMSPLDENHQALLIRLYRLMGDDVAAARQYAAWTELLETELGVAPGVAIEAAMRERPRERAGVPTSATIEAAIESGSATIAAGAIEPGVAALRSAVRLADAGRAPFLRSRSRRPTANQLDVSSLLEKRDHLQQRLGDLVGGREQMQVLAFQASYLPAVLLGHGHLFGVGVSERDVSRAPSEPGRRRGRLLDQQSQWHPWLIGGE